MTARLFVAVLPPEHAVGHLDATVSPLRAAWPSLRWTKPSTWHLTLAFFGDVAEGRQAQLELRLARAAYRANLTLLRFAAAGGFARPARATVLFAGVDTDVPRIASLAARCVAAGRRIGLAMDDRPYRPHLTLARSKGREPVDVRLAVEELGAYKGPSWSASDLVLMRSHLGPDVRYEAIAVWPLGGPPN